MKCPMLMTESVSPVSSLVALRPDAVRVGGGGKEEGSNSLQHVS